jgi:hypothetical protein
MTVLPELHLTDWRPTKDTLHLYGQVVGKIRLTTTPPRNHWWNVPLYVDVRGLTTRRMHHAGTTFQIDFDFVDHLLGVRTMDGGNESFALADGLSVAEFDANLHRALRELDVDVAIREEPFGVPTTTPFPEDRQHAAWDRDYVERFWRVLDWSDRALEEFSGWFGGKASPVHLFWHGFDLATARYSGRPAPPIEGHLVEREAYSREVIAFGFWPGDDNLGDAAYYSYTSPAPDGLGDEPLTGGDWVPSGSGLLAVMPYESVRTSADPKGAVLAFFESAYEAGARLARWDRLSLESTWSPTPEQLDELLATAHLPLSQA